jgi:hypothetical protein
MTSVEKPLRTVEREQLCGPWAKIRSNSESTMRVALVFVVLTLALAAEPQAPRRIRLEELEQLLAAAEHMKDAELAKKLAELELSAPLRLDQITELKTKCPGRESRNALVALADRSAFVEQSPEASYPPSVEEEKQIIAKVATFAKHMAQQMPNFIATRTTTRFEEGEDTLPRKVSDIRGVLPLVVADQRNATLTYRNGQEQVSQERLVYIAHRKSEYIYGPSGIIGQSSSQPETQGLFTYGLFGPLLTAVLSDASQSSFKWGRWEQNGDDRLAVFRFSVPLEKSSYRLTYCCTEYMIDRISAYHGEVEVRLVDGSVARLTLLADLGSVDAAAKGGSIPLTRADMTIEYAPIQIGGHSYMCPVHAVALATVAMSPSDREQYWPGRERRHVNDVIFSDYHVFRSESHILPGLREAADR